MNRESFEALKKQKFFLNGLKALVGIGAVATVYYAVGDDLLAEKKKASPGKDIALPIDKTDPIETWMAQQESEKKLIYQKVDYLEKSLVDSKKLAERKENDNQDLREEMKTLKKDLQNRDKDIKTHREEVQNYPNSQNTSSASPALFSSQNSDPFLSQGPVAHVEFANDTNKKPRVLKKISIPKEGSRKVQNVETAIPSGTSARAVLVSSTDAPCGVYAASDPQPVKLIFLDDGYHRQTGVKVKLKGATAIGNAVGELSSERVKVRVERVTQVKASGDFVETKVLASVSGEDGKYGIRGVVVDRASQFIKNAAVSGFFGGVSKYFQSTTNAQSITQATDGLPNNFQWEMLQSGGLHGMNTGLDKLSDYYIKLAEQRQPVIQIAAGRVVDITFLESSDIGDIHVKDRVKQVRESSRAKEKANA